MQQIFIRNLCVSLLRQNKKDYFETLDTKSITDNKILWKTVAPLFSNYERQKYAEVFNSYFNSIAKVLNIPIDQNLLNDAFIFDDPITAALHKCKRHP